MNGIIMGGGAGLVHPAHYQVCTDDTIFAMPETGIGFFPDVGATYWLNRKADMRQKGLKTHGETRRATSSKTTLYGLSPPPPLLLSLLCFLRRSWNLSGAHGAETQRQ